MATHRQINKAGLDLIKQFEGLRTTAYLCPANVPTIGYGSTKGLTRADVGKKKITTAQAETLLRADLVRFEKAVSSLVKVPLTDNQFAALVSWTFNLGEGNLGKSTLLKRINAKAPVAQIEASWMQWVNAGGKRLQGLVNRRAAEMALYKK
ncbi:GH24 family phage-related lysozyme (muramidase) [Mycoplana sp. BE70]|uniref:lysozyme n=1 Tax=Mycoplana sp. BE70 TaxID=2817775 RepID=UPI0028603842|nr:lysozyme [Mycoplana sp. BE70]MDR6757192.1 GH24 family phage-related lysozyme (muramidase) [Mycoplana sp. BE70]